MVYDICIFAILKLLISIIIRPVSSMTPKINANKMQLFIYPSTPPQLSSGIKMERN